MKQHITNSIRLALAATVVVSAASAQVKLSETVVADTSSVQSLVPVGDSAFVSKFASALQSGWDVSNPFLPVQVSADLNPPGSDQWGDAHYYSGPEGKFLFNACRGGDLNIMDASDPTDLVLLDTVDTNYHWDGIETFKNPATGKLYVACAEATTGGFDFGGILVYEVVANTLVLRTSYLATDIQGMDLKFSPDGRYVYQILTLSNFGSPVHYLYAYDLGDPTLAAYPTATLDSTTAIDSATWHPSDVAMEILRGGDEIYITIGDGGLWFADVSAAPALTKIFSFAGVRFRNVARYQNIDNVLIGTAFVSGESWLYGLGFPGSPLIPTFVFASPTGMVTNSLQVDNGITYLGGYDGSLGMIQTWL